MGNFLRELSWQRTLAFSASALLVIVASSCAQKQKTPDPDLVEKWPKCYHHNLKIFNECVKRNQAGQPTTALDLENNFLPK